MSHEYDDDRDYLQEERPRDAKIDEAKERFAAQLFGGDLKQVFYQRQIEVRFEDVHFHWITAKALAQERVLKTDQLGMLCTTRRDPCFVGIRRTAAT